MLPSSAAWLQALATRLVHRQGPGVRDMLASLASTVDSSTLQASNSVCPAPVCTSSGHLPAALDQVASCSGRRLMSSKAAAASRSAPTDNTQSSSQHSSTSRSPGYTVQVAIKAFEKRYLDEAARTLADLMLISFAPKAIPSGSHGTAHAPSALYMPLGFKPENVDWRNTRFTVNRGPHIDKTGLEQFEIRKYKAVAAISTPSMQEVRWFLDSVKLYDFPGVQIEVSLTSSTYLTPTQLAPSQSIDPMEGLLASHRAHIARYLPPASSSPHQDAAHPQSVQELQSMLHSLKQVLYAGLQNQRQQLSSSNTYASWHTQQKASSSASITAPAPTDVQDSLSEDHLLKGIISKPGGSQVQPTAVPEHTKQTSAFLAAFDAVLLGLNLQSLETYKHFPMHFTTYRPGKQQVPAAEWMQAVLQATHAASQLEANQNDKELNAAYASYAMFAHALLGNLFKLWVQQTSSQLKPHLALPPQEMVNAFLQQASGSSGTR